MTVRKLVNPLRRRFLPHYDVLLRSATGPNVAPTITARLKLLVPSGSWLTSEQVRGYDFVAMQAPDNHRMAPPGFPVTLLAPPVYPLSDCVTRPEVPLPPSYVLTAFNPYDPIKGLDDLSVAATAAPIPIVWCHSERTVKGEIPSALREHPNIIHCVDPSPSELLFLYQECSAYLCFSKSEGFGWSIADALRHAPAIISREIGVLTFSEANQDPRVCFFDSPSEIDWSVLAPPLRGADRSLPWLGPDRFRNNLLQLLGES